MKSQSFAYLTEKDPNEIVKIYDLGIK